MTADLGALRFRWPWRDYQTRLLDALPDLLADGRLHVVAAPGSGKTVLGLEVFRRLGKPAVVLSPTRTIRDQWLARLEDFGYQGFGHQGGWAGSDLGDLRFFTSLTYQALHTRMRSSSTADQPEEEREEDEDGRPSSAELGEVAAAFTRAGVGVLILDEAHHLRSDWWAAISELVAQVEGLTLVSLTGTPPYDVLGHEWSRYIELCGPIDEEISVPELVQAGTLCPHEDYVWLTELSEGEKLRLVEHRERVMALCLDLSADPAFTQELAHHPYADRPQDTVAQLMNAPATAMALLAFLRGQRLEPTALMELLDAQDQDLPALDEKCWELILREYLFAADWPGGPDQGRRRSLSQRMRDDGLLWRRELSLAEAGRGWPQPRMSPGKVDACAAISQVERQARGDGLRQVILTDYIRDGEAAERQLGAWPVFRELARTGAPDLALHTGRLTIVPQGLAGELGEVVSRPSRVDGYAEVEGGAVLTAGLTRLLAQGRIRVLVGTRSLLGEGWDAPQVNSLVLASFVGSFMSTNQMRGRAIRTDPGDPGKVASIWHLGTVADLGKGQHEARDLQDLSGRFDTFVGLAEAEPVIVGGVERLGVGWFRKGEVLVPVKVLDNNAEMTRRLSERDTRARRWAEALDRSDFARVTPSVQVAVPPRFQPLLFAGSLRALALSVLMVAVVTMLYVCQFARFGWGKLLLAMVALLGVYVVPKAVRLGILWWRFLPVDGSVKAIGQATRDALVETGLLPAALRDAAIVIHQDLGVLSISLGDGSFAQRSLFADCVHELLSPISKPRYLITRRQHRLAREQMDYHAVPAVLGVQAARAQALLRAWHRRVGPGELIYTRSEPGRYPLLRAQARSFSTAAAELAKRVDRWA